MNTQEPKTILLVEDDMITAMLETRHLRKDGYRVIHASSGEDAIDIVCIKKEPVDLILMDIDLGSGIDGTETATDILKTNDIPLVFLSSHTEPEVVEKTEGITSYGYIVKGSGETVLSASIKMAFKLFDAKMKEKKIEESLRILAESNYESGEDIFHSMVRQIAISQNMRYVFISRIEPDNMTMAHTIAVWNDNGYGDNFIYTLDDTPCNNVATQGFCFYPKDVRQLFPKDKILLEMNAESYCGIPLRNNSGQVIGILAMIDHNPMSETPQSITLLNSFAVRASAELQRKRTEEVLKKSHDRMEAILASLDESVLLVDPETRIIIDLNYATSKIFGYSRDELLGKDSLLLHVDQAHLEQFGREAMAAYTTQEHYAVEFEMLRKDGCVFPTEHFVRPLRNSEGKIHYVVSVVRDITERKRAEKKLRESEKKYSSLFSSMLEGFALHEIICDTNGKPTDYRFLDMNPAFEMLTDLNKADVIGQTVLSILPEIEPIWIENYGNVALTGEPMSFESYSGSLKKYYKVIAFCPQKNQFAVVFNDITERKLLEEALVKKNTLLQASIESPKDMIIMAIDNEYRYLCLNNAHKNVMQYAYGIDVEIGMNILECITSEIDRQNARENYDRAFAGESHSTVQEYGDANKSYYESFYNPILNNNKEIIGITAFARDITERKLSEEKLKKNENKWRRLFEILPVGVSFIDNHQKITDMNQRLQTILGINKEGVQNEAYKQRKYLHSDNKLMTYDEFPSSIAVREQRVVRNVEIGVMKEDGDIVWTSVSAAPLSFFDEICVTVTSDITDRKRTEDALKESEKRLKQIINTTDTGYFRIDCEGRFKEVNPAWLRMHKYETAEEVTGQAFTLTQTETDVESASEKLKQLLNGGKFITGEFSRKCKDGSVGYHTFSANAIEKDGEIIGLEGFIIDRTERKLAEEKIKSLLAEYEQYKQPHGYSGR